MTGYQGYTDRKAAGEQEFQVNRRDYILGRQVSQIITLH